MSFETVRREHCPKCGHDAFRNNVLLAAGHHARVFVECAACGAFVARYVLHAYVDPNFDLTSSLSRLRLHTDDESPRAIIDQMATHQRRAREQFEDVVSRIDAAEAEGRPKDTILEVIRREGILEDA